MSKNQKWLQKVKDRADENARYQAELKRIEGMSDVFITGSQSFLGISKHGKITQRTKRK